MRRYSERFYWKHGCREQRVSSSFLFFLLKKSINGLKKRLSLSKTKEKKQQQIILYSASVSIFFFLQLMLNGIYGFVFSILFSICINLIYYYHYGFLCCDSIFFLTMSIKNVDKIIQT